MTIPLSMDLRTRVLAAVADGSSHRQVKARFGVSAASVSRWRALEREHGSAEPRPMGGDKRSQVVHVVARHRPLSFCQRAARLALRLSP